MHSSPWGVAIRRRGTRRPFHSIARFRAPSGGKAVRCGRIATECAAVFKTVLAILTVLAVVAIGGLVKLPLLPFRMVRDLLRRPSTAA